MKIALCGPPHSGKSVLRERLNRAIRALAPDVYPYVLTTNPDSEGSWFQETYQRDSELANHLKAATKQKWTPSGLRTTGNVCGFLGAGIMSSKVHFLKWNVLQAALPWFRNGAQVGNG